MSMGADQNIWQLAGAAVVMMMVGAGGSITWLRRQKVEKVEATSKIANVEAKDAAILQWQELYGNAKDRAEAAEKRAAEADARADTLLAQARADRAEYLRQSREERAADRAEIEKLSSEVHRLNLKVDDLTTENKKLKTTVERLSSQIGGRRASDQKTA